MLSARKFQPILQGMPIYLDILWFASLLQTVKICILINSTKQLAKSWMVKINKRMSEMHGQSLKLWENSIHATTTPWNWVSCWKSCHSMAWISTWDPISRNWSGMDPTDPKKNPSLFVIAQSSSPRGHPDEARLTSHGIQSRWRRQDKKKSRGQWRDEDVRYKFVKIGDQ